MAIGRASVVAAAALWSLSGVFAKGLDLPPTEIAFFRSLCAGLALLPAVPRGGRTFDRMMVPAIVAFGAMVGLYIAALKATTAANAIFLQCGSSLAVVPLGARVFLGERPDRRTMTGIGLAALGSLAIGLFGYDGRPGEASGMMAALGSGVAYGAVILFLRRLRSVDPIWLSAVNNLGGAAVLGLWVAVAGGLGAWRAPTAGELGTLAAFGVIQMAIPYALFARALRVVRAPEAGLLGLIEPILSPFWVFLARDERPAPATFVGGVLLLAGVAIRYVPWPPRRVAVPRPDDAPRPART
jgi:drug/metabolite transporter (DMT)-like permease